MKLTKTGSFIYKNREYSISLQMKFTLCSENFLCSEIAIHSGNFTILAKFRYNSEIALVGSACFCLLVNQLLHSWLDAIEDKSYELDVN